MKKTITLLMFAVCGFILSGCSSKVTRGNTYQSVLLEPRIEPVPVVADLRVGDKHVTGQASGKITKETTAADIVFSAYADALGQNPPTADGPDALVGENGSIIWKGKKRLTVIVTGYPAWYTNFHNAEENDSARLNVFGGGLRGWGAGYGTQRYGAGAAKKKKVRKYDYYIAPKYQTPLGTPVGWGGVNLEAGLIWGGGAFAGVDFSFGVDGGDDGADNELIGPGVSIGGVYDLGGELQLAYGVSAGYWYFVTDYRFVKTVKDTTRYYGGSYNVYDAGVYEEKEGGSYLAPFIKVRWNFVELTYRGLLGYSDSFFMKTDAGGYPNDYYEGKGSGFTWNNHQLMLGFYFATSKRGT